MATVLQNDVFIKAIGGEAVSRTPVWMMRQAGRYLPEYRELRQQASDFIDFCHNPELCCEATLQPIRRFDLDAAIIFNDILTLPNTMGMELHFVTGQGPQFVHPIATQADVNALLDVGADEMGYVMRAIEKTRQALAGQLPLIGFAGSPWTVGCYMIEGGSSKNWARVRTLLYRNPQLLHALLARLTENTIRYLNGQIESGVDAIMLFDSWGGVLAHQEYESFSLHYMRLIIANLIRRNQTRSIPVIVFTKQGGPWLEAIAGCGCDVIGLDSTIDLSTAARLVGNKVALQGNLDPFTLFASPLVIRQQVQALLRAAGGTRYVFNLGHGIDKDTPISGVEAMIQAVRDFET